jgi:hypothetical protein
MKPISKNRSFGRSSRKREAERMASEKAVAFLVRAIGVTVAFVVLSGGVSRRLSRRRGR